MKKNELTQEEINSILTIYALTKNFSAVGRMLDFTPEMVSNVVKEHEEEVKDHCFTELSYCGPIPVEPTVKNNYNTDWRKELEKLFLQVVKTDGKLYYS